MISKLKLKDVCYIISKGKSISNKSKIAGEIYSIGYPDIADDKIIYREDIKYELKDEYKVLRNYEIQTNDIVFPVITRKNITVKFISEIDMKKRCIYTSRAAYIRVDPSKYNAKFLYNILKRNKYIDNLVKKVYEGTAYKEAYQIAISKLDDFEIPYVPLSIQENIVHKQEWLEKEIRDLEEKKDILYKEI